jgi:hypothetical protein
MYRRPPARKLLNQTVVNDEPTCVVVEAAWERTVEAVLASRDCDVKYGRIVCTYVYYACRRARCSCRNRANSDGACIPGVTFRSVKTGASATSPSAASWATRVRSVKKRIAAFDVRNAPAGVCVDSRICVDLVCRQPARRCRYGCYRRCHCRYSGVAYWVSADWVCHVILDSLVNLLGA